jgi:hypothetical protein
MTVHGGEGVHGAAKGVYLAAIRGVKHFITVYKREGGDFQISMP